MSNIVILLRNPKSHEKAGFESASKIFSVKQDPSELASDTYYFFEPKPEIFYFEKAFEAIKHFAHRKYGGKKVAEHFMVNGKSLFYFTRFILINRFTLALKESLIIEEIIENHTTAEDNILIYNTSPYCQLFKFNKEVNFVTKRNVKPGLLKRRNFYLLFLVRAILGTFLNRFRRRVKHLFLFPDVEIQPLIDRHSLEMTQGNPITDYFLSDFLQKPNTYILEERFPVNEGSFDLNRKNIFGQYGTQSYFLEPYLLWAFLTVSKGKQVKQLLKTEELLYDTIRKEENDAHLLLLNRIHFDLRTLRKLGLIRNIAAQRVFKKLKVKTIGCIDESSTKSRSILNAAKQSGSMIYAIQHGIIHKNHMAYHYLPEDKDYCLFVDKLFVYGESIKLLLQRQHNAAGETIVSGQLRTDVIPRLLNGDANIKIEGLDPKRKIILYTSQPVFSVGGSEVRDMINRDFFLLTKEFPDYQFVLKPHPRETDWSYFRDIAKEVGAKDYLITNADLYLLLSKCEMLLTHCSSVGAEIVNFDKPLVVQDYPNIDLMNYIKDGIGFKAQNITELRNVIIGLSSGKLKLNHDAYENYKKKYSGPIDGKVSERILNSIGI